MLILTGHPRSGTELLFRLCQTHPDIELTLESGVFRTLGVPAPLFRLSILGRAWARRHDPILVARAGQKRRAQQWASHAFMARIAADVSRRQPGLVTAEDVGAALYLRWPYARYVGDKFPDYVFNLGALVATPAMRTLVIHRDPRDVVASYLHRLANGWDAIPVFNAYRDARAIAQRWVLAMQTTAQHRDRMLVLRYDDLVRQTSSELARIAAYLDIDPAGFDREQPVHADSVGLYRQRLTPRQIADVEAVAGDTMTAWGYSTHS